MTAIGTAAIRLCSADQCPELIAAANALTAGLYPPFLQHTAVSRHYWKTLYGQRLAPFQTIAVDQTNNVLAVGNAIPFDWRSGTELPDDGWDGVLRAGAEAKDGRVNAVSALSIVIRPEHRGAGLAARMLDAMKAATRRHRLAALVAPVRPTRKAEEPFTSFAAYCGRFRDDGSPFDPWVRVHWRLGARILKVAPRSMTVTGSIVWWQALTAVDLSEGEQIAIPGGLVPLLVDHARKEARYVEPNLWMQHPL